MPVYSVRCPTCGLRDSIVRRVSERNMDLPQCACGTEMVRALDAPVGRCDETAPFQSPVSGKWLTSSRAAERDARENGYFIYEQGTREAIARNKSAAIEAGYKQFDRAVERTVAELSASGRL